MNSMPREAFTSGGFFLCLRGRRPEWNDPGIVPSQVLSGSRDYCPRVPDAWAVEWADYKPEDRVSEALLFNISRKRLRKVMRWTTNALDMGELGWPSVFFELEQARKFASRFLTNTIDVVLLEVRLGQDEISEFLRDEAPTSPREGLGGHYMAISRRRDGPRGQLVGFDVLGMDCNDFYSWLCHSMEGLVTKLLDVRLNQYGLFTTEFEARRVCDFCNDEKSGTEPVRWHPWMIVQHRLS